MIIVAPTIVLYEQWSYNQFCEERGYDHFTFRNVEEGYVKCYNKVYINHILQGEVDYETYKYEITLLSTLSDKNDWDLLAGIISYRRSTVHNIVFDHWSI